MTAIRDNLTAYLETIKQKEQKEQIYQTISSMLLNLSSKPSLQRLVALNKAPFNANIDTNIISDALKATLRNLSIMCIAQLKLKYTDEFKRYLITKFDTFDLIDCDKQLKRIQGAIGTNSLHIVLASSPISVPFNLLEPIKEPKTETKVTRPTVSNRRFSKKELKELREEGLKNLELTESEQIIKGRLENVIYSIAKHLDYNSPILTSGRVGRYGRSFSYIRKPFKDDTEKTLQKFVEQYDKTSIGLKNGVTAYVPVYEKDNVKMMKFIHSMEMIVTELTEHTDKLKTYKSSIDTLSTQINNSKSSIVNSLELTPTELELHKKHSELRELENDMKLMIADTFDPTLDVRLNLTQFSAYGTTITDFLEEFEMYEKIQQRKIEIEKSLLAATNEEKDVALLSDRVLQFMIEQKETLQKTWDTEQELYKTTMRKLIDVLANVFKIQVNQKYKNSI